MTAEHKIEIPGGTLDNVYDLTRAEANLLVPLMRRLDPARFPLDDQIAGLHHLCETHRDSAFATLAAPAYLALAQKTDDRIESGDLAIHAVRTAMRGDRDETADTLAQAHALVKSLGRESDLIDGADDLRDLHNVHGHDLLPSLPAVREPRSFAPKAAAALRPGC